MNRFVVGSIRLFSAFGIEVRAHFTFFVFVYLYAGWYGWVHGPSAGLQAAYIIFLFFASILFHEYGHCFAARRFSIRVSNIVLFPFGGISRFETMPRRPLEEAIVAGAGPGANLLIIFIVLVLVFPAAYLDPYVDATLFFVQVMAVNVLLLAFNILPVFPLDGGRVLRAALARRLGHLRATHIVVRIAQVICFCGLVLGIIIRSPLLCIVAAIIYMGGLAELGLAEDGKEETLVSRVARDRRNWLSTTYGDVLGRKVGNPYHLEENADVAAEDFSYRYWELISQGKKVQPLRARTGEVVAVVRERDGGETACEKG